MYCCNKRAKLYSCWSEKRKGAMEKSGDTPWIQPTDSLTYSLSPVVPSVDYSQDVGGSPGFDQANQLDLGDCADLDKLRAELEERARLGFIPMATPEHIEDDDRSACPALRGGASRESSVEEAERVEREYEMHQSEEGEEETLWGDHHGRDSSYISSESEWIDIEGGASRWEGDYSTPGWEKIPPNEPPSPPHWNEDRHEDISNERMVFNGGRSRDRALQRSRLDKQRRRLDRIPRSQRLQQVRGHPLGGMTLLELEDMHLLDVGIGEMTGLLARKIERGVTRCEADLLRRSARLGRRAHAEREARSSLEKKWHCVNSDRNLIFGDSATISSSAYGQSKPRRGRPVNRRPASANRERSNQWTNMPTSLDKHVVASRERGWSDAGISGSPLVGLYSGGGERCSLRSRRPTSAKPTLFRGSGWEPGKSRVTRRSCDQQGALNANNGDRIEQSDCFLDNTRSEKDDSELSEQSHHGIIDCGDEEDDPFSENELERVSASYSGRPYSSHEDLPDRLADDGSVYIYREGKEEDDHEQGDKNGCGNGNMGIKGSEVEEWEKANRDSREDTLNCDDSCWLDNWNPHTTWQWDYDSKHHEERARLAASQSWGRVGRSTRGRHGEQSRDRYNGGGRNKESDSWVEHRSRGKVSTVQEDTVEDDKLDKMERDNINMVGNQMGLHRDVKGPQNEEMQCPQGGCWQGRTRVLVSLEEKGGGDQAGGEPTQRMGLAYQDFTITSDCGREIETPLDVAVNMPATKYSPSMGKYTHGIKPQGAVKGGTMARGIDRDSESRDARAGTMGPADNGKGNRVHRAAIHLRRMVMERQAATNCSLKRIFGHFDRRFCGYVNSEEMREALSDLRLKISAEESLELLRLIAVDGGDRMCYGEFVVFVTDPHHQELQNDICRQLQGQLEALGKRNFNLEGAFQLGAKAHTGIHTTGDRNKKGQAATMSTSRGAARGKGYSTRGGACQRGGRSRTCTSGVRDKGGGGARVGGRAKTGVDNFAADTTTEEFVMGLAALGLNMSASDTQRMLVRFDIHGDGQLSVGRFASMVESSVHWRRALRKVALQEEADEEADAVLRVWRRTGRWSGVGLSFELVEMARKLGIRVSSDVNELWVAREALRAPLPGGWSIHTETNSKVYYHNELTGKTMWDHPLDPYYRKLYMRARFGPAAGDEPWQGSGTAKETGTSEPLVTRVGPRENPKAVKLAVKKEMEADRQVLSIFPPRHVHPHVSDFPTDKALANRCSRRPIADFGEVLSPQARGGIRDRGDGTVAAATEEKERNGMGEELSDSNGAGLSDQLHRPAVAYPLFD
ncbi:unnamed protein product, partial [Choristocarpus tenellus]